MKQRALETWTGCGVALPAVLGSSHAYIGSSASCWAAYGEVLAKEYANADLMKVHRLTVDAYAAQHPGVPGLRSAQSVWVHLGGLYLTVERRLSCDFARQVMGKMTGQAESFEWLPPPEHRGNCRITDVLTAEGLTSYQATVFTWAEEVWRAWAPHHRVIIEAADRAMAKL